MAYASNSSKTSSSRAARERRSGAGLHLRRELRSGGMAEVLKIAEKRWNVEQSVLEVERMSREMRKKVEQAELELKTREETNAKTISMFTKFSNLQHSLAMRGATLVKEFEAKELEALDVKNALTEDLKKRFDSLQPRSDAVVARRDKVDTEVERLRAEALAIHKEILDDQPEIDDGLSAMKAFKELNLNNKNTTPSTDIAKAENNEVSDNKEDTENKGEDKKLSTFDQDALDLGVTVEELEEFKLATAEYEKRMNEQIEQEEASKTALMKSSDDMTTTKKDFTDFTATLEGIAGSVEALEVEARSLEREIEAAESRRDAISAKFSGEDAAIREALEESKKLDRLLEALQQKQKSEATPSEHAEEDTSSENEPNAAAAQSDVAA